MTMRTTKSKSTTKRTTTTKSTTATRRRSNSKVNDGNEKKENNNTDTDKDKRYHVTRITDKSFCPETGEILFRMHWDGRQFSEDSNALERQKMKRKTFVPDDEKWQGPTEVVPGCGRALAKCETKWKAETGSGAIDLRGDDDDDDQNLTFLADHQVLAASRYLRQVKSAEHQVIRLAAIYQAGEICPGSRRQFRFDFSNRVSLTIPQDMLKLLSPANKRRVQEMLRAIGNVIPAPVGAAH
ncbi:hypothetical protein TYRP_011646 [Tyrophagus putrescentiae]|nr:hypothetical protein TYRP_011646 [Tyrophagus putrescentiae]